jgi:hypothetical protein
MNQLVCPELSHLSQPNAVIYTKSLIDVLSKEKAWKFPSTPF